MHAFQKSLQIGAGLFFSAAVLQANEMLYLTKTQKQVQQYVHETLTELGIAGTISKSFDPRETLGVSKTAAEKWTILRLLESNTTGNTDNDHAIHLFGDRMNQVRMERRRQVNNLIAALNEVYHRILVNQSMVRTLGIRLIDFFNDQHNEHDCDERFQQNAKRFLDLVNQTFQPPAVKLPFASKDLKGLEVEYYYPKEIGNPDKPDRPVTPPAPPIEEPEPPVSDTCTCPGCTGNKNYLHIVGDDTYTMSTFQCFNSVKSDEGAGSTLDLGNNALIIKGEGETIFGCLKDANGTGSLFVTEGTQNLDCSDGSSVGALNVAGTLNIGASQSGSLRTTCVYMSGGTLALGNSTLEDSVGSLTVMNDVSIPEGSHVIVGADPQPTTQTFTLARTPTSSQGGFGALTVNDALTNDGTLTINRTQKEDSVFVKTLKGSGTVELMNGSQMTLSMFPYEFSGQFTGDGVWNWRVNSKQVVSEALEIPGTVDIRAGLLNIGTEAEAPGSITSGSLAIQYGNCFVGSDTTEGTMTTGTILQSGGVLSVVNGSVTAESVDLKDGNLYVGYNSNGETAGLLTVKGDLTTSKSSTIYLGYYNQIVYAGPSIVAFGQLDVQGVLNHYGKLKVWRTPSQGIVLNGLTGNGSIELCGNDDVLLTIQLNKDDSYTGTITRGFYPTHSGGNLGDGIVHFTADHPVTFTWPYYTDCNCKINKDDNVTIVDKIEMTADEMFEDRIIIPHLKSYTLQEDQSVLFVKNDKYERGILDLNSHHLTITGSESEADAEETTSQQTIFKGMIRDTGKNGTLTIATSTQAFDPRPTSKIHSLVIQDCTLTLGRYSNSELTVENTTLENGTLVVGERMNVKLSLTNLTLNEGTTLFVNNVIDGYENKQMSIGSLSGSGTVHLAEGMGLSLKSSANFQGTLLGENDDRDTMVISLHNALDEASFDFGDLRHPLKGLIDITSKEYSTWYIYFTGRFPQCILQSGTYRQTIRATRTCEFFAITGSGGLVFGKDADIIVNQGVELDDFRSACAQTTSNNGGLGTTNGRLVKRGPGRQIFACCSYGYSLSYNTGETRIEEGILAGVLPTKAPLFVAEGATYQICCYNGETNVTGRTSQTVVGLRGDGVVELGEYATQHAGDLTVNVTTDIEEAFSGQLKGTGSFIKSGAGTQSIALDQPDFTGKVEVKGGTLVFGVFPKAVSTFSISEGAELELTLQENTNFSKETIAGTGTLILKADHPVTVTWPYVDDYNCQTDENVTILGLTMMTSEDIAGDYLHIPANKSYVLPQDSSYRYISSEQESYSKLDINSQTLTVSNEMEGEAQNQEDHTTAPTFRYRLTDTGNNGTFVLASGTQNLDTDERSLVHALEVQGGRLNLGSQQAGTLKTDTTTITSGTVTVGLQEAGKLETGTLTVEEGGILALGSTNYPHGSGSLNVSGKKVNNGLIQLNRLASNFSFIGWEGAGTFDLGNATFDVGYRNSVTFTGRLTSSNTDYEKQVITIDNYSTLNTGMTRHSLVGRVNFASRGYNTMRLTGLFPNCVLHGSDYANFYAAAQTCECRALLNKVDLTFGNNTDIIITYGLEYDDFRSNRAWGSDRVNGRLIKRGEGRQIFNNGGSFTNRTGETRVEGGTLSGVLCPHAPLFVATNAVYQICCYNGDNNTTGIMTQTIAGLRGDGIVELGEYSTQHAGDLTVNVASGVEEVFEGQLKGAGTFIKDGAGSQTISAAQEGFSGKIEVKGGTLVLGNWPSSVTDITVADGTNLDVALAADASFEGIASGTGTINLHSENPVTFTWPHQSEFTGTVNKDDTVTIVS